MPLTPSQKRKVAQLREISKIACIDFWNVENTDDDNSVKDIVLDLAKDRIIRADVVFSYVLIDELLSSLICQRFFRTNTTLGRSWRSEWKKARFQNFNYHVLEGMSLLRKLALVKEFLNVPKDIEDIISRTNIIRNALAHSFFPMNKKEFRKSGIATYKGKDIFSLEGLRVFDADANKAIGFLSNRAHGAPDYP
jgi:hypothetical protein